MDWTAVLEKRVPVPWKPTLVNDTDTSYFSRKYTVAEVDDPSTLVWFGVCCEV